MIDRFYRVGTAALVGIGVFAMAGPSAHAQLPSPYFQVRPGLTIGQYAYNVGLVGQALQNFPSAFNSPYARIASTTGAANPYLNPYGSMYNNPYGYDNSLYNNPYSPYYYDPYGGYLRGAADVINSQGRLMVNQQQAFMMREQYRQEKLNTRRKSFDEYRYEMQNTPTPEEDRQRRMLESLSRSRNNPPVTEIYSGKALNDLLAALQKAPKGDASVMRTFPISLDEESLKRINLTKGNGSIAILRNDGKLDWPVALSGPDFKEERERVASMAREAVNQASYNGKVDSGTIQQLSTDADRLRRQLKKSGNDLTPSMYMEANNFLNSLNDAIKGLQQPDVGSFFTGKIGLTKVKTVSELVKLMSEQGLKFAPAVSGDENSYVALHQALVGYDRATSAATTEK